MRLVPLNRRIEERERHPSGHVESHILFVLLDIRPLIAKALRVGWYRYRWLMMTVPFDSSSVPTPPSGTFTCSTISWPSDLHPH